MFNYGSFVGQFKNNKVLGGYTSGDTSTQTILYAGINSSIKNIFAGPDPADDRKALIRKLVQVNQTTYCIEEIRITPATMQIPTVHSQMFRIKNFNFHEHVDVKETNIRLIYRPMPNVMGFSLYCRQGATGMPYLTIVENSFFKNSTFKWREWWSDFKDRRDMAAYIKGRWNFN